MQAIVKFDDLMKRHEVVDIFEPKFSRPVGEIYVLIIKCGNIIPYDLPHFFPGQFFHASPDDIVLIHIRIQAYNVHEDHWQL